jgi:hypothetical protein
MLLLQKREREKRGGLKEREKKRKRRGEIYM